MPSGIRAYYGVAAGEKVLKLAFVFRNASGNRIKVLVWDGNGVWLCRRRLHQGHFIWPTPGEAHFVITQAQWEWLISGVDWQRLSALPPRYDHFWCMT